MKRRNRFIVTIADTGSWANRFRICGRYPPNRVVNGSLVSRLLPGSTPFEREAAIRWKMPYHRFREKLPVELDLIRQCEVLSVLAVSSLWISKSHPAVQADEARRLTGRVLRINRYFLQTRPRYQINVPGPVFFGSGIFIWQ